MDGSHFMKTKKLRKRVSRKRRIRRKVKEISPVLSQPHNFDFDHFHES